MQEVSFRKIDCTHRAKSRGGIARPGVELYPSLEKAFQIRKHHSQIALVRNANLI